MVLSNQLWDFSLEVYSKPGVETACLGLQNDYSIDVSLLLFCIWVDPRHLTASVLGEAIAISYDWSGGVVSKIRDARKWIKYSIPEKMKNDNTNSLHSSLKELELSAERIQQKGLQALVVPQKCSQVPVKKKFQGCIANVWQLLDALSVPRDDVAAKYLSIVVGAAIALPPDKVSQAFNDYHDKGPRC